MEDCSHATVYFDRRLGADTCLRCRRASYEFFETWCATCERWQRMLIYIAPDVYTCGHCHTPLLPDAPRRKEIRWS
jgi:hypothetical protein